MQCAGWSRCPTCVISWPRYVIYGQHTAHIADSALIVPCSGAKRRAHDATAAAAEPAAGQAPGVAAPAPQLPHARHRPRLDPGTPSASRPATKHLSGHSNAKGRLTCMARERLSQPRHPRDVPTDPRFIRVVPRISPQIPASSPDIPTYPRMSPRHPRRPHNTSTDPLFIPRHPQSLGVLLST